jgi:hypothetical protein
MRTVIIYQADNHGHRIEIGRAVLLPDGQAAVRGLDDAPALREQLVEHGLYVWPPTTPRILPG